MVLLEDDDDSAGGSSENENENENENDNDVDETMEDVDEEVNGDGDGDLENEEDNEDNEDDDEQDDAADNVEDTPVRTRRLVPQPNGIAEPTQDSRSAEKKDSPILNGSSDSRIRGGLQNQSSFNALPSTPPPYMERKISPYRSAVRKDAIAATVYDIVPTIAAPHSTSINSVTSTPDLRWVFSGGADGWIRKFNWPDTANSKSMLTVAQRHPFVDSVTKAGVLMSYWENEETADRPGPGDDTLSLSPVYSLAVHHQALWLLSGTEGGAINLQSVRHEEGKRITSLQQHTSAVSVLQLSEDETSVLSGSWDKTIIDWDLNTGQVKRNFMGSGGQISAIEMRPLSTVPVPRDFPPPTARSGTLVTDTNAVPKPRGSIASSRRASEYGVGATEGMGSPTDSLFGGNGDNDSLFGDNDGSGGPNFGGEDEDDEFSKAVANGIQDQESIDASGDIDMTGTNFNTAENAKEDTDATLAPTILSDLEFKPTLSKEGLPHSEEVSGTRNNTVDDPSEAVPTSESTFLDAAIDGTIRIWDRRQANPVAKVMPSQGVPPWCMHACWSPDGNYIYAGRRNGTVQEYSLHKGLREPTRTLKFPTGSGPVSAVRAMPNGKHLVCASYDILRLYDLTDEDSAKHARVPFLIVPGHRTGVISHLYIDPTCTFMISIGGNRGWEGLTTEVLLGYEIGCIGTGR